MSTEGSVGAAGRDSLAADLHVAGQRFLRTGLDFMYQNDWAQGPWVQPSVANMTIGIELICKSFLVSQNPLLVFRRLEPEAAWAVHHRGFGHDQVPFERMHTILEAGGASTIGLADCMKMLQVRFPEQVQALGEWGRRLAGWRAVSVHFVLPNVETLAVRRVAFSAISLAELLNGHFEDSLRKFHLKEEDQSFLAGFNRLRAQDLDRRLQAAKKRAKDMRGRVMIGLYADAGKELTCEVCGNDGIAFGEKAVVDGGTILFLSEFTCDECGLRVFDTGEMQQLGFATVHEV